MYACFHCNGTVDVAMDRLNSCAKGLLKTGAPSFKNQDGSASRPVAVGRRRSRALKTCHSVMYSLDGGLAVSLQLGGR